MRALVLGGTGFIGLHLTRRLVAARRCPDLSKLWELTAYEPMVSLEDGVRRTLDWCRESWPAPGQDQTGGDPRP